MKIELTKDEINFIIQVLGELPTKTGAYVVLDKLVGQVANEQSNQIPKIEAE